MSSIQALLRTYKDVIHKSPFNYRGGHQNKLVIQNEWIPRGFQVLMEEVGKQVASITHLQRLLLPRGSVDIQLVRHANKHKIIFSLSFFGNFVLGLLP